MTVTRQSLTEHFHLLNDAELQILFQSGDLTDLAQEVAAEELKRREIDPSAPIAERHAADQPKPLGRGDLILIARFSNVWQAQMLQGRLEVEGVPAIIADANIVQTNPLLTIAVGGARVLVPESHVARAREIATAIERGDYTLDDQTSINPDMTEAGRTP